MPLNQALVGSAYPAIRYEVGREKLREFAVAVGETDPIYHDQEAARAAGHPDIPAVPTFAVVLSLRAGDRLLATGKVAAVEAKGRHELLTLETEVTTEDGEPVCTVRAMLLSRGTAPPRGGRS